MDHALEAVLEIFIWVGFAGFFALAVVLIGLWAADGTWLAADAIIDRDGDLPTARWIDADGDANSAELSDADARALDGQDAASIWYRHGWHGRMRLTRRAPGFTVVLLSAGGMLALGVLCVIASWVMYFAQG